MKKISSWAIQNKKPVKLQNGRIDLEKHLEDWIEQDPSLIRGGLTIVARQLILEGGRLDLLAIDPQGRWVVIELKAGKLENYVITQSLFYVSQIAKMPYDELLDKISPYLKSKGQDINKLLAERGVEKNMQLKERETISIVVGTSSTTGLNKLLDYLGNEYKIPVSAIVFDVFEAISGEKILIREITESDFIDRNIPASKTSTKWNLDDIRGKAKRLGIDNEIEAIINVANKCNLYVRPYANSIMITPLENKSRLLFTFWIKRNKDLTLKAYVGSDVFPEFYDVTEQEAIQYLGNYGWRNMTKEDLNTFIKGVESLFEKANLI